MLKSSGREHESDTQRGRGQDESKRARVVYSSKDGSKEVVKMVVKRQ